MRRDDPQALIIDAVDTLWENNIYFEQAWDDFVDFLSHSTLSPKETRDIFDEIEIANIKVNGYGAQNFAKNMVQCYRHLVEREVAPDDAKKIIGFADRILHQPIELIEGVEETHPFPLLDCGNPQGSRQMGLSRPGPTDQNQVVGALHESCGRQLLNLRLWQGRFRPVNASKVTMNRETCRLHLVAQAAHLTICLLRINQAIQLGFRLHGAMRAFCQ